MGSGVLERIMRLGGFWLNCSYCGALSVRERYSEEKLEGDWCRSPLFVPLSYIEKEYGRIVAVKEYQGCDKYESMLVIWTERYVIRVCNYDGCEFLCALPRNPPEDAELVPSSNPMPEPRFETPLTEKCFWEVCICSGPGVLEPRSNVEEKGGREI